MSLPADRASRSLNYLSIFLACVAAGACCVALAGCGFFEAVASGFQAKDPNTGIPGGSELGTGILGILLNPANWNAWAQFGAGLLTVSAGTYGYMKFKKK